MLNPSSALFATLIALPAIFAQGTNTTSTNTTAGAAAPAAPATPADATNGSATRTSPGSNPTFAPTNFTPTTASGPTCGTAQQNFNQCITKVGKDISSCTDNVCLCQTYANIAACYNGCADLSSQGEAYQAQSTQYCATAGVKPNTTATTLTPTTSNTSTTPTTSNTTPIRNNGTSTNTTSNASTFSAAKGSASSTSRSVAGVLAALAAAAFVIAA